MVAVSIPIFNEGSLVPERSSSPSVCIRMEAVPSAMAASSVGCSSPSASALKAPPKAFLVQ